MATDRNSYGIGCATYTNINADVILLVEQNKIVEALRISWEDLHLCFSIDINDDQSFIILAERLGKAIGESTHLKALMIEIDFYGPQSTETIEQALWTFSQGLASSSSIVEFVLKDCQYEATDIFGILAPFFDSNNALLSLRIIGSVETGDFYLSLATALSNCESLEQFEMERLHLDAEHSVSVIDALKGLSHLKNIALPRGYSLHRESRQRNCCLAIARLLRETKSLDTLDLERFGSIDNELLTILTNALNENKSIKRLNLSSLVYENLDAESDLSGDEEEESIIGVEEGSIGDDDEENIDDEEDETIEFEEESMERYEMRDNKVITSAGWCAFSTTLFNPFCKLGVLHVGDNCLTDDSANSLGNALAVNKTLVCLNIDLTCTLTARGWRVLFESLGKNCTLQELSLRWCHIESVDALAHWLSSNTSMRSIDLMSSPNNSQLNPLFGKLHSNCNLEHIDVRGNVLGHEGAASMINFVSSTDNIHYIGLADINNMTDWHLLWDHVQEPTCSLKGLGLPSRAIGDEIAMSGFAGALANNASLTGIRAEMVVPDVVSVQGMEAVANALCDESTITNTYSSNHTLHTIEEGLLGCLEDDELQCRLRLLLMINETQTKANAARLKILKYHHPVDKIASMNLNVLPLAISWIGRDSAGLPLLYDLARRDPDLFDTKESRLCNA